jgi:tetratricopeptide (TPR) repeat protein
MTSKKKKQPPTQSLEDIETFCWRGAFFGSGFIALYVINATSWQRGLSALGIIGAVSGASFVLGFLIGFLFGVPRTIESNNSVSSVNSQTRVQANTNLEQISDWLTKILVGVGLTQITPILSFIKTKVIDNLAFGFDLFDNQNIANYRPSSLSISITIGITSYFLLSGFIIGYFYTVLVFSQSLKDNLEQKLEEKIDNSSRANNRIQLVRQIIDLVSPFTTEGILLDGIYMSGRKKDSSDILSKIAENVNKSLDYLRKDNDTIPKNFDDFVAGLIENIDSDDYVLFRSTDYVNLAVLLALKGDKENAKNANKFKENAKNANKFLDKAISTNQYSYDAYNLKGLIDNKLKNYDLAIESFNRAIEIDRKNVKAWENKGGVLVNKIENSIANIPSEGTLKLANELLECSNRAITLNPISAFAYVNRGYALSVLNEDRQDQLQAFKKAGEIDPEYSIAFYNVACIYSQIYGETKDTKDAKESIQNLQKAIGINNDIKRWAWARKEKDFAFIKEEQEFVDLTR